jgi:hypothetical protein
LLLIEYRPLSRNKIVERRFKVILNGKPLFIIGFNRDSFLADSVYITLRPLCDLSKIPRIVFRQLLLHFNEISGYFFYCQIEKSDLRARRFAEFFGFTETKFAPFGRLEYEKDQR